jgi:hypothetical protein
MGKINLNRRMILRAFCGNEDEPYPACKTVAPETGKACLTEKIKIAYLLSLHIFIFFRSGKYISLYINNLYFEK